MYEDSIKERLANGENPEAIKRDIKELSAIKDDEKEVDRLCKLVDSSSKKKKK